MLTRGSISMESTSHLESGTALQLAQAFANSGSVCQQNTAIVLIGAGDEVRTRDPQLGKLML